MPTYNPEPAVYVGTYCKYNKGSLTGAWLKLSDYTDHAEFISACLKLHNDESDPELMFQDQEHLPSNMFTESSVNPLMWDFMNHSADWEAKVAFMDNGMGWDDDAFDEAYEGEHRTLIDFAESLADDLDLLGSMPEHLRWYFDYEKYGRDLLGTDYWCDVTETYYFRNI
jgi:antirestriction protein